MAGRNTGGRSTTSSYPTACSASFAKAGIQVVERCWEVLPPGSAPKAGLVVIHGGSWHSGWFGELGDLLSSPEYSIRVSAPDLLSHGLSDDPVEGYRYVCTCDTAVVHQVRRVSLMKTLLSTSSLLPENGFLTLFCRVHVRCPQGGGGCPLTYWQETLVYYVAAAGKYFIEVPDTIPTAVLAQVRAISQLETRVCTCAFVFYSMIPGRKLCWDL